MKFLRKRIIPAAALMCSGIAHAEDIDLFVGAPATNSDLPNVLIIIDNTANWNQMFEKEMAALLKTFDNLESNKFNVGIMLATETGNGQGPNNNVSGGYVRAALRAMTKTEETTDVDTIPIYQNLIKNLDKTGDVGNAGYSAMMMVEAYRYITGGEPYAGNYKAKTDYDKNKYGNPASVAVYDLQGHALSGWDAKKYEGVSESSCAKTAIIYISNGPNQQSASTDTLANNLLQKASGKAPTQIAISPTGSQSNPSDEWARFMLEKLGVVTYVIDVYEPAKDGGMKSGQVPGWTALLKSMASTTDGKLLPGRYTPVSSTADDGADVIAAALGDIFDEIQDTNSVFASVSLPLSVNTQGTYLNQVYVGMFRPDRDALPRWAGNLKQYKMGYVNNDTSGLLRLLDAKDKSAVNPLTGFVAGCSQSFWSPTSSNDYWAFAPNGTCSGYEASDSPDGNIVEKGAQAFVTRSTSLSTPRKLFTCLNDCGASDLKPFHPSNTAIDKDKLGAATDDEAAELRKWAWGLDVDDEDGDEDATEIRPSIHGDVVHSRPVALNFSTADKPKQVVVFYGGNDGVFRAVNGNRGPTTDSDLEIQGVSPGGELWGFVPKEFLPQIRRIRNNNVKVSFPNVTSGSPLPKPYGIDGGITAHRADADSAWIFASMRRGGRALYAFGIDTNDLSKIALKWRVGCTSNSTIDGLIDNDSCSSDDFEQIGQTWSQPKVIQTSYSSSPFLIMGGGYDTCEDKDPAGCGSSPRGSQVFVLDADTGKVETVLDTERSVIAEIAVVTDAGGIARHAYAVDLGGNIYRIDVGSATSSWTIRKIAALGCDTASATCIRNRKFMFAPDILLENGNYVLLLGSGDREKPRNYYDTVENHFFMIKDGGTIEPDAACGNQAIICLGSLIRIGSEDPAPEDLAAAKGWYLPMRATEQVVTSAITIFGTVTFSTHEPEQPQVGVCKSDLGQARVYNVFYANAASANGTPDRSEELPSDIGLPPSPVAGAVELDDGSIVPFCIGCDPESPLQADRPPLPASSVPKQPKGRVYWYIER